MNQIGRLPRFYPTSRHQEIKRVDNLKLLSGYSASSKFTVSGMMLNIDCCTKILPFETILDEIRNMQRDRRTEREIAEIFDSSIK